MIKQFTHYVFVGGLGTLAHYLALIALHELLKVDVLYATTAGFIIGALVNYFLNYHFTFKSTHRHRTAAPRFFAVALFGMLLNYLLMYYLQLYLHWFYLFNQIIATAIVVVSTYLANRFWTFSQHKES